MRVLVASHTARIGGGEHSLLTLLPALAPDVVPVIACPEGPLAEALRARGLEVVRTSGLEGGFALHPVHTPRAVGNLVKLAFGLRRAARRADAALIHANSVRAGLAAVAARSLGGPPAIVHVRDCLPAGPVGAAVRRAVAAADCVIANSRYTAASFGAAPDRVRIVYPSIDPDRFDPSAVDRDAARTCLGLAPDDLALGVVAQLTPWKGQDLALRALARLREEMPQARLLFVGEAKFVEAAVRYDNRAYERQLRELASEAGLAGAVSFLGERHDMPEVLAALDVQLAPSWEEPFGRAVVEGMAMGLPVIATEIGGPAELIDDGIDGLLLPPHDPVRWAATVLELARAPERRAELGRRARRRALEFTPQREAEAVLSAYGAALRVPPARGRS